MLGRMERDNERERKRGREGDTPWAGRRTARPPARALAITPSAPRAPASVHPSQACTTCPSTCIRTWCCPVGTHSRPSSGQQPPQRCTVTQLGTSCLATVPMSSTVKGTTTSRGWQVARAYTSIHDTTGDTCIRVKSPLGVLQQFPGSPTPVPSSCLP